MNTTNALICKQAFHRLFQEYKQILAHCRGTDLNNAYFTIMT